MNITGVQSRTYDDSIFFIDDLEEAREIPLEELEQIEKATALPDLSDLRKEIANLIRSKEQSAIPRIVIAMTSTQLCLESSPEQQVFENFILQGPWKETMVISSIDLLRDFALNHAQPVAQLLLGLCYESGSATFQNSDRAICCVSKAAEQNFPLAQAIYSSEYLQEKNHPLAFEYAKRSARQNSAHGHYALATCYRKGIYTGKNEALAFQHYLTSAKLGSSSAELWVGTCYMQGSGVTQDQKLGFEWIKKSAERGDPAGQRALAICFKRGLGVKQDDGWEFYWDWMANKYSPTSASLLCQRQCLQLHSPRPESDHGARRSSASSSQDVPFRVLEEDPADDVEFPPFV